MDENIFEQFVSKTLEADRHIDDGYKQSFKNILVQLEEEKMNTQTVVAQDPKPKVSIFRSKYFLGSILAVLLLVVGTGSYLVARDLSGSGSTSVVAGKPASFAKLYINSGEVAVSHNGEVKTYTNDAELQPGDIVKAGENSIADIQLSFGRLALDSGSEVVLDEVNGVAQATVNAGTIFASVKKDFSSTTVVKTQNADVELSKGVALITQNSNATIARKSLLVPAVYAEENDNSTKVVSVSGKVVVKTDANEIDLANGKEVVLKDKTVATQDDVDKDVFKTDFYKAVAQKEQEDGNDLGIGGDLDSPIVVIISPANGDIVQTSTIDIKFKSNEDGWLINESPWREITANTEEVYTVDLNPGENSIELKIKDKSYNLTLAVLTITYQTSTPTQTPQAQINLWGNAESDGIRLNWSVSGLTIDHGFKVIMAEHANPVYPGDEFHYLDDNSVRSDYWDVADGKTYHFRVCKYNGNGVCLVYSNDVAITAPAGATETPKEPAVLQITGLTTSGSDISVSWEVVSGSVTQGFKILAGSDANPTYPANYVHYVSDSGARSFTWTPAEAGTYHVRVCHYDADNGACLSYSNDMTITVE